MAARSQRWKQLERDTAATLGGERVTQRAFNWFTSAPDVVVPLPTGEELIVECKAHARFAHHRLLEHCDHHYCTRGQKAALATRERGGRTYITVELGIFAALLNELRKANPSENFPEGRAQPLRIQYDQDNDRTVAQPVLSSSSQAFATPAARAVPQMPARAAHPLNSEDSK